MLLTLVFLLTPPPMPPPPDDALAAAIRLLDEHPPNHSWVHNYIQDIVREQTHQALLRAGIKPHHRQYDVKYGALQARLTAHVPTDLTELERPIARCAAQTFAYAMTADEIDKIKRALSTPEGKKFWLAGMVGHERLGTCYQGYVRLHATDEDYRAVGIKPPKPEGLPTRKPR